jgi:hypothetical protein
MPSVAGPYSNRPLPTRGFSTPPRSTTRIREPPPVGNRFRMGPPITRNNISEISENEYIIETPPRKRPKTQRRTRLRRVRKTRRYRR